MSGHIKLTGKYLREAENLLFVVSEILQYQTKKYSLEGGTLLGVVRENRLLPWDDDVDLSVLFDDINDFDGLLTVLKKSGLRVKVRNVTVASECLPIDMPRVVKIRFNRFFGLWKSKVCLDLFVKYRFEDKVYWGVGELIQSVPAIHYDGYETVCFKNRDLFVPKEYKRYLTHKYGDWSVAVKEWSTFIDDYSLESK